MGPGSPAAKQLFLDALDRSASERDEFLRSSCGEDEGLLEEVRALLAASGEADELIPDLRLKSGAEPLPGTADLLGLRAGVRVDRYTLIEELGEGGFGTVWVAEQHEPVARRVALKVLKPSAVSLEVVQRFHEERRLLARMQHEGIATLYDGGATESGLPWFAMELVQGVSLTRYCSERSLSLEARVDLFLKVCTAVQHAHQKGVVHRDLKPSNVLVAEEHGRPVPKVIDFGIAKLVDESSTEEGLQTRTGLVMGTPAYLSPEQVDDSSDVDTRSDVYSLGVLLYELLCEHRPLDEETLRSSNLTEILRRIREVDPPRPSERLAQTARAAAKEARTTMLERIRGVSGDLDWITMRCLRKDRDERYPSVAVLVTEIERHQRGEPVLAGPPHMTYRLRKFARRHRVALSGVVAFLGLLVVSTVVSITLAVRAQRAEGGAVREAQRASLAELDALDQAAAAELARAEADAQARAAEEARIEADAQARAAEKAREAAKLEAAHARAEAAKYEEIALFLQDVLHSIDPAVAQGKDRALLREILGRAATRIDELAGAVPEVEAKLRLTIAQSYYALSLFEPAEPQLRRALELLLETHGEDHVDSLTALNDLGGLCGQTARLEESRELLERALDGRTLMLGPDHEQTLISFNNLASVARMQGKFEEAEAMHREILDLQLLANGPDSDGSITAMHNLAGVLDEMGRVDESIDLLEEALDANLRVHGEHHPHTLATHNNLGFVHERQGNLQEAEEHLAQAVAIKREIFGPQSSSLMLSLNNLAQLVADLGRPEEAEGLFLESLEIARARARERDERAYAVHNNYGIFLLKQERPGEAVPVLEFAEAGYLELFGEGHPRLTQVRQALADARLQTQ